MTTDISLQEVQSALDTIRADPEACHSAHEVLAQIPTTLSELSDREQIAADIEAGYATRREAIQDLARLAAHDLYRAENKK